ncbi:MAG: site-specific integrase [Candidatus Peribacteria bacterium]|nr:site-specific integrase [Candidatus Peribacteria bacterium]
MPLVNDLCKILISYLEKRKDYFLNSNILFPTAFGNNMQHRYIYEIFYKVRSKLDFKFTPHTLRHTFATECVRKNINIYNISRIL